MNSEQTSHSYIYRALAYWTSISYRHALWVLLTALLITIICCVYISRNLGMNTDTTDMLSEELPFRINLKHYNKTFPQDIETLLIVSMHRHPKKRACLHND